MDDPVDGIATYRGHDNVRADPDLLQGLRAGRLPGRVRRRAGADRRPRCARCRCRSASRASPRPRPSPRSRAEADAARAGRRAGRRARPGRRRAARRGLGRARSRRATSSGSSSATGPPTSRPPPTRPASWSGRSPARARGSRSASPRPTTGSSSWRRSLPALNVSVRAGAHHGPHWPHVESERLQAGHELRPGPDHPGRPRRLAGRARALPAGRRARPARGRTASIIVRQLLGLEDVDLAGPARPDPRRATAGPSTSTRAGVDPVLGIERLQEAYVRALPGLRQGHHGARRWSTSRPARSSPTTSRGSPTTSSSSGATTTAPDAPDLWPADVRDEMDEVMERVYTEVNNGVYRCGFAGIAGGVRRGVRPALDRAGLARGAADRPALPDGRHDHRGRRPAVHDAGPLRRGLPRPLQVQPAEADRDAGAVGLRPRPVPDARRSATPSTSSRSSGTTTSCTTDINPTGIVPRGPDPAVWLTPHGRG